MTEEEKIICKQFLNDADKTHSCNEYKLLMALLEQEPTTKNDLGVDWEELKRKILMEVDGGTDDKWLRYADVCDRISDSIDKYKAESEG